MRLNQLARFGLVAFTTHIAAFPTLIERRDDAAATDAKLKAMAQDPSIKAKLLAVSPEKIKDNMYVLNGHLINPDFLSAEQNKEVLDFFNHGTKPGAGKANTAQSPPSKVKPQAIAKRSSVAAPHVPSVTPSADGEEETRPLPKPDWIDRTTSNKAMCW
jgi:hypothetical protein